MIYRVTGYMNLRYHFVDVEVEVESEDDITEWDIIENSMSGWDGEMMDYEFDGDIETEGVNDE